MKQTRSGLLIALLIIISVTVSAIIVYQNQAIAGEITKIKQYNILGRTGLTVSDIGFGAGGVTDPAVIQYAVDMGINYFDTAEGYGNGKSEEIIGKVAAKHRDKMVICTKLGLDGSSTKEDILTRFDKCLKRLQTSFVDILMIHGGNDEALNNQNIYDTFDQLKKDKKIKFTGVSHHGPNITTVLKPIVDQNKLDVILCSYAPHEYDDMHEFLKSAKDKAIGLVAMKVFTAARNTELEEFKSKKFPFNIAALRWALKTSNMDTILVSINLMDQVDEYVPISGFGKK